VILAKLRNASNSLVIKIIFGAIIFSFCLWGVGDIIKNYSSTIAVVTVGDTKITADDFLRAYELERQRIRNSAPKPLSDEEMQRLNIKQNVLDKVIQTSVIEQAVLKLNITVSQKTVLDVVRLLPEFQRDGMFDDMLYEAVLRRSGISEAAFQSNIREHITKSQMFSMIASGYKLPSFIKDIMAKEFETQCDVLIAKIDLNKLKYDNKVDEDTLKQFYENNPEKYKRPEMRDVAVLILDYERLVADMPVDENEVHKMYEDTKDSYVVEETRDFERFAFGNGRDATTAWKMLVKGESTTKVSKKLMAKKVVLNKCRFSDFPVKVGKDLFHLKKNKVSNIHVINGISYIYKLTGISGAQRKSEAEVKAIIRRELQKERISSPEFDEQMKALRTRVDDGLGSDEPIESVAKATGMQLVEIKGVAHDSEHKDLSAAIPDEETRAEVVDTMFNTDEQQASPTIPSRTGGAEYVVAVKKVHKENIPEYSVVRAQTMRDFVLEKKNKLATDKINEILSKDKEAANEVAKMDGVKLFKFSKMDVISHSKNPSATVTNVLNEIPSPNVVLNVVSTLRKGEATYYKVSDTQYVVIAIRDMMHGNSTSSDFASVMNRYVDSCTEQDAPLVAVDAFKRQIKVKVNEARIASATKHIDVRTGD
jgi:peptidyl-prolyl cis-trans isomerase D